MPKVEGFFSVGGEKKLGSKKEKNIFLTGGKVWLPNCSSCDDVVHVHGIILRHATYEVHYERPNNGSGSRTVSNTPRVGRLLNRIRSTLFLTSDFCYGVARQRGECKLPE